MPWQLAGKAINWGEIAYLLGLGILRSPTMKLSTSPVSALPPNDRGIAAMEILREIASSPDLVRDLAWPFEFDIRRATRDLSWLAVAPPREFKVLAGEGSGGFFLAYGDAPVEDRPVLYVSSEGEAGKIAANLATALSLFLAFPFWQDILKFSGGGVLSEMRKTAVAMDKEFTKDHPDLQAIRDRITAALSLPLLNDPVWLLHTAVSETDCTAIAKDGWKYSSLFGKSPAL